MPNSPTATPELPAGAKLHTTDLPAAQQRALEQLARTDWTFADTQQHAHSLHPYPAKFIPQVPRTLIGALHRALASGIASWSSLLGSRDRASPPWAINGV